MKKIKDLNIKVANWFKYFGSFAVALILTGVILLLTVGMNIGLDFAGGATVNVELGPKFSNEEGLKEDVKQDILALLEDEGFKVGSERWAGEDNTTFEIGIEYSDKESGDDAEYQAKFLNSIQGTEEENFKKSMPCENITVTNCTMLNGHGGVVIGSEMSGGVRNVVVNNCVFNGTDRGVRIKTRRLRGGCLEDMMFSNIIMDIVWVPVCINEYYFCNCDRSDEFLFSEEAKPVTEKTPVIKNINISNISAKNACVSAIYMKGLPELPISGITLSNVSIDMKENEISGTQIPILAPNIPQTNAEGIYIENAKDCTLNNVTVTNQNGKDITLVNCEHINVN